MAETFCGGLRTAARMVFARRMCPIWSKSPSQPPKRNSPTPHEAPELTQLQAESYVGVRQTLSLELARGTALRCRNRFFNWYLKSCTALLRPKFNTSTPVDRARCTLLRANHSHQSELAECFRLLSIVYFARTFKTTPLTLLNPQSEMDT